MLLTARRTVPGQESSIRGPGHRGHPTTERGGCSCRATSFSKAGPTASSPMQSGSDTSPTAEDSVPEIVATSCPSGGDSLRHRQEGLGRG